MGSRAEAYPDLVMRIHDEGHTIASHTYWHPNLPEESIGRLDWELKETEQSIEEIVGYKPALFRAPYGALNKEIVEHLAKLDYTVVGWSTDSVDWRQLPGDEIARTVLSNADPGALILMHDGGNWDMNLSGTIDSLEPIINQLQGDGMEFVTVDEMLGVRSRK